MVRRANPVDFIWAEAPRALTFLTDDWGFSGPERTDEGVAYHRPGLHVEMGAWSWKNERGFTTTLALVGREGKQRRASLSALYAASGLGAPSAVPAGAGTLYVIGKRIRQHAAALRTLLAYLDQRDADALFKQCSAQPRTLPDVL